MQIWNQHVEKLCARNWDNQWRLTAYCNFRLKTYASDFNTSTIKPYKKLNFICLYHYHVVSEKVLSNIIFHIFNNYPIIDYLSWYQKIASWNYASNICYDGHCLSVKHHWLPRLLQKLAQVSLSTC